MADIVWKLLINWNAIGFEPGTLSWAIDKYFLYDPEEDESSRMIGCKISRGRSTLVDQPGNGFSNQTPGTCVITLDNFDGRYDPYNTESPLYPSVAAGAAVNLHCYVNDGGDFNRFTGYIESIEQVGGSINPQTIITVIDTLGILSNEKITVGIETDIATDDAVNKIIENVRLENFCHSVKIYDSFSGPLLYPLFKNAVSSGADEINYWYVYDKSALEAVHEITDYECGGFAARANGDFMWVGRNNAPSSVVTIDQSEMLKDVQIPMPYNVVRNCTKVYSYPKTLQSTAALWTLGDKPYVGPSSSIEVWGDFKYDGRSVAAINCAQPVATTDYLMNTAEDGTGTNKTADFTVAATYFGKTVKNVITNNGTTAGAYVTLLQNRGQAVDTPYTSYAIADTSGTDVKRMFIVDTPWMQDTNKAQQYADYLLDILGEPQKYPVFQLENQFDKQFSFDLLDRITVTMAKFGISQDFRVGGIEEEWLSENGQAVRTTVYTEPFVSATPEEGFWFFPTTFPTVFPY